MVAVAAAWYFAIKRRGRSLSNLFAFRYDWKKSNFSKCPLIKNFFADIFSLKTIPLITSLAKEWGLMQERLTPWTTSSATRGTKNRWEHLLLPEHLDFHIHSLSFTQLWLSLTIHFCPAARRIWAAASEIGREFSRCFDSGCPQQKDYSSGNYHQPIRGLVFPTANVSDQLQPGCLSHPSWWMIFFIVSVNSLFA